MSTAIEFNNISKLYRLGLVSTGTFAHDLKRWWTINVRGKEDPYLKIGETNDRATKGESDYVWALKDINFKVEQGDVVGIIGKNGAGKSTLLKILSKVTAPTTGVIKAKGRIGSLLEVGTGFHGEMTGRENIYLNGAILGMSKPEITKKLDEIIDFSGCERYIDTPVKRYSSGMMVRLGFAVAAHLDPEILVVDEVLAVGDAEFQKKAIGKMQDVSRGEGRTVLFVSHNMAAVRSLCKTGIILEQGRIIMNGTASDCVNYYLDTDKDIFLTHSVISDANRQFETRRDLEITETILLNDGANLSEDEDIIVKVVAFRNNPTISKFTLEMMIDNMEGQRIGSYISPVNKIELDSKKIAIVLKLSNHNLSKGKYYVSFNIGLKSVEFGFVDYDVVYHTLSFEIIYSDKASHTPIKLWRDDWGNCHFRNGNISIQTK